MGGRSGKRREAARQESVAFELVFDAVRTALGVVAVEDGGRYRVVAVNRAFEELTGHSRDRVVGDLFTEHLPPAVARRAVGRVRRAVRTRRPVRGMDVARLPSGERRYEVTWLPVVDDGRVGHVVASLRDVTDEAAARQALAASEALFREMAESSPDIEILRHPEQGVVYVSPSFDRITGYARAQYATGVLSPVDLAHPEDLSLAVEHHRRALSAEHTEVELRLVRPDGTVVWIRLTTKPVHDPQGRLAWIRTTGRDVTEARELAAALEAKGVALRELLGEVQARADEAVRLALAGVRAELLPVAAALEARPGRADREYARMVRQALEDVAAEAAARGSPLAALSDREAQIAAMVRAGHATKEIADILGLSPRTVDNHRESIRRKLGLAGGRASLAARLRRG